MTDRIAGSEYRKQRNERQRDGTSKQRDWRDIDERPSAPGGADESGRDVDGRQAVPADLGHAPEIKLPEEIVIAITVDIDKRFNIPPTPDLYRPEATIGTVIVKKDGRAYFNGQPLTSEESHGLAAACQKQGPAG